MKIFYLQFWKKLVDGVDLLGEGVDLLGEGVDLLGDGVDQRLEIRKCDGRTNQPTYLHG